MSFFIKSLNVYKDFILLAGRKLSGTVFLPTGCLHLEALQLLWTLGSPLSLSNTVHEDSGGGMNCTAQEGGWRKKATTVQRWEPSALWKPLQPCVCYPDTKSQNSSVPSCWENKKNAQESPRFPSSWRRGSSRGSRRLRAAITSSGAGVHFYPLGWSLAAS